MDECIPAGGGSFFLCLGGLVRDLSNCTALVEVFEPKQVQGNAAVPEPIMDIVVVGHFVDGIRGAGREQVVRELLVRHALWQRLLQAAAAWLLRYSGRIDSLWRYQSC